MDEIRAAVLRGIALNRTPGFHFAGNFLGMELLEAGRRTHVAMAPAAHNVDRGGTVPMAAIAMAADIALAASVRAQLQPASRLATVSMHLQLDGNVPRGTLEARGEFAGFVEGAASRQGVARVTLEAGGRPFGFGHGAFMALQPPPGMTMHPVQPHRARDVALPREDELDAAERAILERADRLLAHPSDGSFVSRFLGADHAAQTANGADCRMENGVHVGNRVGHAQGGILVAFAAQAASASLGPHWQLVSIAAAFVSPGEGPVLEAAASVVHRGRWTGVTHVDVAGPGGRRVLDAAATHARRKE